MAKVITNIQRDEKEIVLDEPPKQQPKQIIVQQTCTPSVQCTPPQPPITLTETRPKITHIKRRRRARREVPQPAGPVEYIWFAEIYDAPA